jgi:hypothetical protein
LSLVEDALAKCAREEQRWAQAYAAQVISIDEIKGYRAEIGARRESLIEQRQVLETRQQTIGQVVEHVEALIGYCERVRQRLQTFDAAEKRLAFEALNVRVTWTPGQPLAIKGTTPFHEEENALCQGQGFGGISMLELGQGEHNHRLQR